MHSEKDQKIKSDDTVADKQIATSTKGCLLLITQFVIILQYLTHIRKKSF